VDVHLRRDRSKAPETLAKIHIHPGMAAIFPLKKNYVPCFPTVRITRHLDPFSIDPRDRNLRGDHAIPAQSGQPRHLRSKRALRLVSRPLDSQCPSSTGGCFHPVNFILGNANQVDARVPGKIVEAKRLLG
jgi:hypothetical protein